MTRKKYCYTQYEEVSNDKLNILLFLAALAVIMILVIGAMCITRIDSFIKMQVDALDKLNEISVTVDPEDTEPASSDPLSYMLSPEERDLVCRVVAAEARGEDLQGQMAVAQTILDRAELWDMTPAEVVTAPGQYADPYPGEISDEVYLAVANVFDGGVRVFEEPVTHFYSGAEPDWAGEKINRGSVGCHRFYY